MSVSASGAIWSVGDSLERVVAAVRGRVSSIKDMPDGSYLVNCINPSHDDRHPSLHISHMPTPHGGRVVFRCFSCGDAPSQEDYAIWAGLEYDDLFDDRRQENRTNASTPRRKPVEAPSLGRLGPLPKEIRGDLEQLLAGREPSEKKAAPDEQHSWETVERYSYTDAQGRPVQRVTRQRCTDDGCHAKNFPQTFLRKGADPEQGGAWAGVLNGRGGAGWGSAWKTPMYRHPQVVDAIGAGVPIWVLEGEKDVHTAEGMALVATTNPGGATAFPAHLAQILASASELNVVLDRDKAGWARGVRIAAEVEKAGGPQVRLWLPAVTDTKADFTDHVEAGHGLEDLISVPQAAVAAWELLTGRLASSVAAVHVSADEAAAQKQVLTVDRRAGRKALAADRDRYATRWAKEALRQHARVIEAAHRLVGLVQTVPADAPGGRWAREALESARTQVRSVTTAVHSVCDMTGVQVPAAVAQGATAIADSVESVLNSTAAAEAVEQAPSVDRGEGARPGLHIIPGGGGGGGGDEGTASRIEHDNYAVVDGELVQVLWRTRGDQSYKVFKRIVSADLRVHAREMAEADEDIASEVIDLNEIGGREGRASQPKIRTLRQVTHVVVRLPRPADAPEDYVEELVRIPFDEYVNGAFLSHLPIADLDFNGGRSGREKVVTAINHVSDPLLHTAYRATGWRTRSDGSAMYLTASGAIDATGWVGTATNLTGSLARFDLPDPVTDPARLREAFSTATAPMVDRFPDRIGAVLVGQAFRAALCPNEWVTVLSASPGVGKTGLASLAMHYFGESWDRNRPMSSMSGNGATDNALRILAHQAKDAVVFLDDNAPTAGIEAAWKRLESTIRMIHNQESRTRSDRAGQSTLDGTRPRTSAIITTELPPRAGTSGERRALIVPMSKRDVLIDDIKALDELELRHRRSLLMSSYLRWLASDYRGNLLRLAGLRDEFVSRLRSGDVDERVVDRHGVKVAELWAGWGMLLEMLVDSDAMTNDEATVWRDRIEQALIVAAESAEDPDLVESTGQRACELLRFALTNGMAYAADSDNGSAPAGLERRLGWRPSGNSSYEAAASGEQWKVEPRAISLGHVQLEPEGTSDCGPELLCERSALEAVIKAASASMPDTSGLDLGTVLRALEDEGVLKVRVEQRRGGTVVRRTLDRTIRCMTSMSDPTKPLREKRIVLRLDALFGEPGNGGSQFLPLGDNPVGPDVAPETDSDLPTDTLPMDTTPAEPADQVTSPEERAVDYTNSNGLTLTCTSTTARPCAVCGKRCGVAFGGVALHIPCFLGTNAATVDELTTPTEQPATVAPVATVSKPRTTRGQAQAAAATRRFRAAVAVVDVAGIWLPDGTRLDLPFEVTHLGHLEQIGRELGLGLPPIAKGWSWDQAGVIVPTDAMWAKLGVPVDQMPKYLSRRRDWFEEISNGMPALSDAVASGWVFGRGEGDPVLRVATKLRVAGQERGAVQLMMTAGMPQDWGLTGDVAPATIARRLQLFADAAGIAFSGSPINTALDLFKGTTAREKREQLTAVDWSEIAPAMVQNLEGHFNWTRTPSQEECTLPTVWFFDRNQSYLATWSSLTVGIGRPEHHDDGFGFDPKRPGWWRISLPDNTIDGVQQHGMYPDLLDPDGTQAGKERWVTTPALAYAVEKLDARPVVLESWTWPEERSTRLLDGFYKRIKAALDNLHQIGDEDAGVAASLVKQLYKQLSGHVVSNNAAERSDPMWQPYIFHATRAQARVAILNRILDIGNRQGSWPVVVSNTDMLGWVGPADAPLSGWPGDPKHLTHTPGMYKPSRRALLADQLPFLNGKGWGGIDATTDLDAGGE